MDDRNINEANEASEEKNRVHANGKSPRSGFRFKWLVIIFSAIIVAFAGSGYWVLGTASGFQWLLSAAVRMSSGTLEVDGINGTFSDMQLGKLHYREETLQLTVNQFKFNWSPVRLLSGELFIHEISAARVDVHTFPAPEEDTEETALPDDLSLPLDITAETISVKAIHLYSSDDDHSAQQAELTISDLSLRLQSDAQRHQLTHLSLHNAELGKFNMSGHMATAPPFALESVIRLDNSAKWGVTQAGLSGSLELLEVMLTHHKAPMRGAVKLQLQPFTSDPFTMLRSVRALITGFNPAEFFPDTPDLPQADLTLRAAIKQNDSNQLVGGLALTNNAAAPLDQDRLPFNAISVSMLLTEKILRLDHLKIQLPDNGTTDDAISGNIVWRIDQSAGQAKLNVNNLNPAALDTQLQPAAIDGWIELAGDTDRQQITIKLSDEALKLDVSAVHAADRVALERLDLRHGQSRLTGTGALNMSNDDAVDDADDAQTFRFNGQLEQFNIADFVKGAESNLNAQLDVTGSLTPEISAVLDYQFKNSHLNRQPVTGAGRIAFEAPLSLDSKADFQIGSNHLNIDGKFGKPGDALAVRIYAPSLAQAGFGLSGYLNAQIDLQGTPDQPAVDFDVDSRKLQLPGNLSIDSLSARGKIHPETLSLMLVANELQSEEETQLKQLDLKVSGEKTAHILQTRLQVDNEITIVLHADGGLIGLDKADETPGWQGQLTELSVTGPVPAKLQAPASALFSSEQIVLQNMQFMLAGGLAKINNLFWSPQQWQSDGHFSGIRLHPDSDLIPADEILQLGGKWQFESPASLSRLAGDLEILRENGDWYLPGELPQSAGLQTLKLAISARDGIFTGQFDLGSALIGDINANLKLSAPRAESDGLLPPDTRLEGQLSLNMPDLSWLDPYTDNTLQAGGEVALQASIAGTLDKPVLQGNIRGKQLAIALLDLGLNLDQGELIADFDQSALHIDRLHFVSPYQPPPKDRLLMKLSRDNKPGSLTVSGSLGFVDNMHDLTVALDHLYLVNPPHYWIAVSGNTSAQFINNVLDIDGEITADAGLLTQPPTSRPQLADDIVIVDDSTAPQDEPGDVEPGPIVNLHVTLDLGKQFFLRVAGLVGRLSGNLQLQNDENGALSAVGSIATRQATYTAYGQDLTVTRGIVNFHGPLDDPGLNIQAVRQGLEVEAGVEVAGSVRHPRVKLISTPHVPDTEKLSWIVLGRAPDTSGMDTSMLVAAAGAILGSGGSGSITGQLGDMLGVDEISLRQGSTPGSTQLGSTGNTLGGQIGTIGPAGSTLSGQIGTIGKRISSRAYLSYERGITTTTAGITKLTYSLTPTVTVVTQAGEDSAVDLFYTFRFD